MELPEEFTRLRELAYNLWWTWSLDAQKLFSDLDSDHWQQYRNPVEVLINVHPRRWEELRANPRFVEQYHQVLEAFDRYTGDLSDSWFRRTYPDYDEGLVAYFSAEYGWHEGVQTYSGGLGILSGDHCKSASDLGVPMVGVGLLYRQGYFRQTVDPEGQQQHFYPDYDLSRLPVLPLIGPDGEELRVKVDLPDREVALRIWKADVGRIPVLLLDTDIDENDFADRSITSILYVRGREMRLCQEILLGIGGARALETLGITPAVWHMNEGHSSFLSLERLRREVGQGSSWGDAIERIKSDSVFTTHTPVPAGNEQFDYGLIEKYMGTWCERHGLPSGEFLNMGRAGNDEGGDFNLTALAIRTSRNTNGVSKLHGEVANDMWRHLWDESAGEQPVGSVTNGVHVPTWLGPEMQAVLAERLGRNFLSEVADPGFADAVRSISDAEIWQAHSTQKTRLLQFVRSHQAHQYARYGRSPDELRSAFRLFNPEALTIGFARRFATYKRADLLLRDLGRLQGIVSDADRPVQFLFAGKAHPADRPGQDLIRRINEVSHQAEFAGKLVFLENYDMQIGRFLMQGVDLWLNNPRRPLEASGTSGMKAAMNGGLNCSILDGWWCEGYDPSHGWQIGAAERYEDEAHQDAEDAEALYNVLTDSVMPCYYQRDSQGLPTAWIARMKEAMATLIPQFSADRMVCDYVTDIYRAENRS
ncbi:hypothetical protein ABI59_23210 [Acidobacteria bacterium Mor1]|nr:hypothetical protein ABI59_23210 [Acidobacteria bacterium Mor1]